MKYKKTFEIVSFPGKLDQTVSVSHSVSDSVGERYKL